MAQLLLIRGAKQLLTLRGPKCVRRGAALQDLAVIYDGSILIRDGLIHSVGTTRRIENLKEARGADEMDVSDSIVMPGFVDAGIHLSSGAPGKRRRLAGFYAETLSLMRSCCQHGTLNAQVKIGGAENGDWRSDLSLLRQLAKLGNQPVHIVRTWRIGHFPEPPVVPPGDYGAALSILGSGKLIHNVEVIAGSGAPISDEMWESISNLKGIGLNLHWRGDSEKLLADLLDRTQPRSVSCRRNLTVGERAVLARSPVPVTVPVGKCLTEETATGTARKLAEIGAPIALSSGYHPDETPVFNMQMIIALAVLRLQLTPEEAISAATINGAYALGLGHVIGSLEVGKRADLLVLNLPDYREIPRRYGVNHVAMAIREGKIIFNRTGRKLSST